MFVSKVPSIFIGAACETYWIEYINVRKTLIGLNFTPNICICNSSNFPSKWSTTFTVIIYLAHDQGTECAVEVKMGHEQGHMANFLHFVTRVYFEVDEAS